ncbi:hypothetical protein AVEN_151271-1 [Araneus ventricosus]|uniref:Uncharacterized protein n=1 Tax=Araneus ventricosus TaxID=182803 RepID=A0A4Y2HKE5_ARAVE|nr:hypothetical protein AVEN_151271-1 [Araneus ventricosus]
MPLKKFDQMLIGQVQGVLEFRWSHRIIHTHFKKKGIAISLSHINRIKNSKFGSTKNDSKPIKNGRQSKLKKSDSQRLEKMASKPDPPTEASMAKALNVSQQVGHLEIPHGSVSAIPDPQQWMPNSPDAAPCDYFLWGYLKNKLNKRRVSTLRCLQKAIREEVKKIHQEMILKALKSWPKRCKQIYYAEGRHIEKHR